MNSSTENRTTGNHSTEKSAVSEKDLSGTRGFSGEQASSGEPVHSSVYRGSNRRIVGRGAGPGRCESAAGEDFCCRRRDDAGTVRMAFLHLRGGPGN